MFEISENFPGNIMPSTCSCGEKETMIHLYKCEKLNCESNPEIEYEEIFGNKIRNQISVFEKIEENLKVRQKYMKIKEDSPCDLRDPLTCIVDSNG